MAESKLFITRGLPGSGKSTGAEEWARIENACGRPSVVIGRDHIRLDILRLGTTLGSYTQEQLVTDLQQDMVRRALRFGYQVCVDDTNLPRKRVREWYELAWSCNVEATVIDYTGVPLEICLNNNKQRYGTVKFVPEDVIMTMHSKHLASGRPMEPITREDSPLAGVPQYVPDTSKQPAYLFDIDGTLARMQGRGPFEWSRVGEDSPVDWVTNLLGLLYRAGYDIVCLSGRDECCRGETADWLFKHSIPCGALYMRPENDYRKDNIVKAELFFTHVAPHWNVQAVFDDRDSVVRMWREIGLPCAQVNYGDF